MLSCLSPRKKVWTNFSWNYWRRERKRKWEKVGVLFAHLAKRKICCVENLYLTRLGAISCPALKTQKLSRTCNALQEKIGLINGAQPCIGAQNSSTVPPPPSLTRHTQFLTSQNSAGFTERCPLNVQQKRTLVFWQYFFFHFGTANGTLNSRPLLAGIGFVLLNCRWCTKSHAPFV